MTGRQMEAQGGYARRETGKIKVAKFSVQNGKSMDVDRFGLYLLTGTGVSPFIALFIHSVFRIEEGVQIFGRIL